MKRSIWLILGGSLIFAGCTLPGAVAPGTSTSAQITGTVEQQTEKLGQIIASGGSASCKITNLADKSEIEYVISGKKIKITGTDLGAGKKGMMLTDGTYTYTWQSGTTTGFKTKLTNEEEKGATTKTEETPDASKEATIYEDETKFKMECSKGNINDSEFTPPADVKFVDTSELNKMTPEQIKNLVPQGR